MFPGASAVAPVHETEVGHDLGLVLLVAELAERRRGLFEEADCPVVVAQAMLERLGMEHVQLRVRERAAPAVNRLNPSARRQLARRSSA